MPCGATVVGKREGFGVSERSDSSEASHHTATPLNAHGGESNEEMSIIFGGLLFELYYYVDQCSIVWIDNCTGTVMYYLVPASVNAHMHHIRSEWY